MAKVKTTPEERAIMRDWAESGIRLARSDVANVLDDIDTLTAEVERLKAENAKAKAGMAALGRCGVEVINIAEVALRASVLPGQTKLLNTIGAAEIVFKAARDQKS